VKRQLVAAVQELRRQDLAKAPGVAETLDWAEALLELGITELDSEEIRPTLGTLLKSREDIAHVEGQMDEGAWPAKAG
jgi:hypothetical protein